MFKSKYKGIILFLPFPGFRIKKNTIKVCRHINFLNQNIYKRYVAHSLTQWVHSPARNSVGLSCVIYILLHTQKI